MTVDQREGSFQRVVKALENCVALKPDLARMSTLS